MNNEDNFDWSDYPFLSWILIYGGINIILYLLFSFIALTFNPANWWIMSEEIGRVLFIVIEIIMGIAALRIYDDGDFLQ